jgi:heparanase
MNGKAVATISGFAVLVLGAAACFAGQESGTAATLAPSKMVRLGVIDERFQSYNIEAVEVTGGRFWKPFAKADEPKPVEEKPNAALAAPGALDPSLYEYRQPIDLSNARLRKLAAALGPAYLRVSGTWMNSTYFQESDGAAPAAPPKGFNSVLTRQQWKGVVDFSHVVHAGIVTSFATSAGTRDAEGVWTPAEAKKFIDYTKSVGGELAAAEFMNEPTFAELGGAPKGYDAEAYAKDFAIFKKFVKAEAAKMLVIGPGGVGEGTALVPSFMRAVKTDDILSETGPQFDAFSYHSYGAVSSRCAQFGASASTTADAALSEEWLARSLQIEAYYAAIRDRLLPSKSIWLTETAQAACGGDRWASSFLDSFRYLNQLGSLAKAGVQVHMHNTLAASDYGLLDEKTFEPRPNYWAALLWRKLMGTTVLDAGSSPAASLHMYAQCMRGKSGGVTLLAINADKTATQTVTIPTQAERYTLTAADLLSARVDLNGNALMLGAGDELPTMKGVAVPKGKMTFAPESITFLALPKAGNPSCE